MLIRWFGITFAPSPWRLVEGVDEAFVTGDAVPRDKASFLAIRPIKAREVLRKSAENRWHSQNRIRDLPPYSRIQVAFE
jgi:hypothetical protein